MLLLADLPTDVLQELRVIGGTETPSAADAAFVMKKYQRWLQTAVRDWNATWDEDDDVPTGVEDAVVMLVANICAPSFAKAYSPERQKIGEDGLRLAMRRLPSLEPPTNDYF